MSIIDDAVKLLDKHEQLHVAIVTSGRADWSGLSHIHFRLEDNKKFDPRVFVCGGHLSGMFHGGGIGRSGDRQPEKVVTVDSLLASQGYQSMAMSAGLCAYTMAQRLFLYRPDVVVLLGDRYESLATAMICTIVGVPIIHLHGGEVTTGAIDERLRHAITKLADVHCCATWGARDRLKQLGEDPDSIHVVGTPGLEALRDWVPTPLDEVWERHNEEPMEFKDERPAGYLLVTVHPQSADGESMSAIWEALSNVGMPVVVTGSNQDGMWMQSVVDNKTYVQQHRGDGARFIYTSGQTDYLDLMHHAAAVVGNSSSGILEAPSVGTPSVDIGERQAGRARAESVVWAPLDNVAAIEAAIHKAVRMERGPWLNPYDPHGTNDAAARVVDILANLDMDKLGGIKPFHDMEVSP